MWFKLNNSFLLCTNRFFTASEVTTKGGIEMRLLLLLLLFMKLFKTSSIVTVRDCQSFFGVDLPVPSIVLAKRFDKFVDRYGNTYT